MNRLTVGLATYRDFDGVYFTMQSLRAHHGNNFDILVLDNAPERCIRTEQVTRAVGGIYYHRPDLTGTSKSRDALFHLAQTPWVMVCDSHVLFEPGAILELLKLIEKPDYTHDFFTGPLVWDDGKGVSTHWRQTTPPGLWGVWEGGLEDGNPFDIPMQGLGCFAMAKDAWPGFHPLSRGFGGEEGYIHEKVRRAGGRVLCVPQLRWRHRFRDIGGWDKNPTPYPALTADHVFNLLVQHRELGIEAEESIHKDFGNQQKLPPQEWERLVAEAKAVQPFGEQAKGTARQTIIGIWYTDNTAPPQLLANSLRSISISAKQTWRHEVALVACGWEKPQGFPENVLFVHFKGERKRSHATIVAQIIEALEAGPLGEIISFLEHDVIYPENYFQRIGDAFANNPSAPVVSNLDYIGLNAQGWQPVKERHEPMHQLSMRTAFALENMKRVAREAESGSALLEPQGDRSNWVRLQPTPGLGLLPAVHVNHTSGRFTSHGDVCYAPAIATNHPHWGESRFFWPQEVIAMANQGCGGCGGAQPQQQQFTSLDEWFEQAKKQPSDFHEHVQTLRDLASKCEHVSQIGIWGKPSRIALSHNGAAFVDYAPGDRPEWAELKRLKGDKFTGKVWQPFAEIEETDLLFIDTYHTAEETLNLFTRHSPKVRKYLVVHTTEIFGEKGDNGQSGVLIGVREFLRNHREWNVLRRDTNNYGLIVLSKVDGKELPGIFTKMKNYAIAKTKHIAAGSPYVSEEIFNQRIDICLTCEHRNHDSCSACGCPLNDKAAFATEPCGLIKLGLPPKWEAVNTP